MPALKRVNICFCHPPVSIAPLPADTRPCHSEPKCQVTCPSGELTGGPGCPGCTTKSTVVRGPAQEEEEEQQEGTVPSALNAAQPPIVATPGGVGQTPGCPHLTCRGTEPVPTWRVTSGVTASCSEVTAPKRTILEPRQQDSAGRNSGLVPRGDVTQQFPLNNRHTKTSTWDDFTLPPLQPTAF